jgi:hypothetical protein
MRSAAAATRRRLSPRPQTLAFRRRPRRLRAREQTRLAGAVRALLLDLEAPIPPTREAVAAQLLALGVTLERR